MNLYTRPEPAAIDPASLIREDRVHRDIYTSPDIFRLEMDRLFGRAWIYLAHESQIKEPGDYVGGWIGDQGVIVVRQRDGSIAAFYNRCPHRGATLCADRKGSAPKGIVCPYHGWRFDYDGTLKVVPQAQNYDGVIDLADFPLTPVEQVETYRGFVFGCRSRDAGPLLSFLGHMKTSIDDLCDRAPDGEVECSPYVLRHHYRANWKLSFENLNDTIHPGFAHAASVVSARAIARDYGGEDKLPPSLGMMLANGKPIQFFQESEMITERGGHSYIGGHMGADYSASTKGAYFEALAARLGEKRASEVLSVNRHLMLLYPSSTWHARYQTVRIIRPVRADLTEVIGYVFRLEGAPEETFVNAIEYCNGANSAFSPVISDDLEIYERCQQGNEFGGREWIPTSRGLHETMNGDVGQSRSPATSEAFIRNQYKAWAEAMSEPRG
jgi:phenylpropionate dioxygenase-like ring-hydroxylating dioxygenase large terminal subunit